MHMRGIGPLCFLPCIAFSPHGSENQLYLEHIAETISLRIRQEVNHMGEKLQLRHCTIP